jgi:hypothetical protein
MSCSKTALCIAVETGSKTAPHNAKTNARTANTQEAEPALVSFLKYCLVIILYFLSEKLLTI